MLTSMTGYGKVDFDFDDKKIAIEIKSLNSKQLDIIVRMPNGYREKELEIRSLLGKLLVRGKIDLSITAENVGDTPGFTINKQLAKKYYEDLSSLSEELNESGFQDILSILVKMPEVLTSEKKELSDEEWKQIKKAIYEATEKLILFRKEEGTALEEDMIQRNIKIVGLLEKIPEFESNRNKKMKEKLFREVKEVTDPVDFNENRFEQELIYYLEKLDISEEKVRLKKHCSYFSDTINQEQMQGKKLIFITQEIGREINTIGSKANDANIQRLVVQMKEQLEKIKEQLHNIL
ncbi:MAG: YicC family protein [Bacteroidales bacterium]|nr:YicC family protein [Bacteroidales bacterium]